MTTATGPSVAADTLYMIRGEISVNDFHRWMGGKRLADPDHAMHCLLTEGFGELAPKPFRLITPRGQPTGFLYGYAKAGADALREAAADYADPEHCRALPPEKLDSKTMPSDWPPGKRLGFEVRVRPTRRLNRPAGSGGQSRTVERDAYQMQAEDDAQETRSREEVYCEWLRERLQQRGGAALEFAILQSFQRHRAHRKRHGRSSEGPDALLRGVLTVTDPAAFARLLCRGLGRHRAYGYGMLLLRPPGKGGAP